MYKLENNVNWTDELKNAFKHGITRAKIIYDDQEINYDNGLKDIELQESRYVPNLGFIGQATARMATINLLNNSQNFNLENKELEIYIGADYNNQTYYINYGKFIVDSAPENDETNNTIKVIAYDYMIKFNKEYVENIVFPCTLKQLLINVCSQAGVQLGTTEFSNQDFIVTDNQFEGKTLREVLQNIAKCAFSWARIGQDNKVYLDFENEDIEDAIITEDAKIIVTEDNEDIITAEYTKDMMEFLTVDDYLQDNYKKANEYYGAINKVTYGDSNITGQEESVENTEDIQINGIKELVINDNYFAYTTEKRHQLIQAGTKLFGFKYMPLQQLKTIGLIYLDCNDIIKIEDNEGNYVITRCFSHIIRYNGATNDEFQTEADSNNEKQYKNKNSAILQNTRTEIIVDRHEKKITSITQEIGDRSQKTTTITQDIDGINSRVEDIEDVSETKESITGTLNFEKINNSEPIYIEIRPRTESINHLSPSSVLKPANNLYIKLRTIRFVNTTTNENIDYELPADLLYYNSQNYDTFILDYENNIIKINKKCDYDNNGNVVILQTPRTDIYEYTHINLTKGNYTVKVLKYDNTIYQAYLKVSLMKVNKYTEQFASKVTVDSEISQTATAINLRVNEKLDADEFIGANIILAINDDISSALISADKISLTGKEINLTSDNIVIKSNNFNVDKYGILTAKGAKLNGELVNYSSNSNYLAIKISDTQLKFYDFNNEGMQVGGMASTTLISNGITGVTLYGIRGKHFTIGYKNNAEDREMTTLFQYPALKEDALPYIRNTSTGTLWGGLNGGGIKVENGLIKTWNIGGVWSGNFKVATEGGYFRLTFSQGLLTAVETV